MNLTGLLEVCCIAAGQSYANKDTALREIARIAKKNPILADVSEDEICQGLIDREELGSTGFGDGIAIPHCRLDNVPSFVVGLVTVPDGIAFDALDEEPVHLMVFIIGPTGGSKEHIRILSTVSQTLNIPGAKDEIIREPTAEAVLESFLRHVEDDVDVHDHESRNLFHLVVQNEEMFEPLVQAFASAESCSVTVVESQNAGTYLANLPLFAGFWGDGHVKFSKIILATVEKQMTNEMIRRIEQITGNLDDRTDIMLMVQPIFYASGTLED